MTLEVKEERKYNLSSMAVYEAAQKAIAGLEGRVLKEQQGNGELEAVFDKKILGKVLGERTHLDVKIYPEDELTSTLTIEAYPLDAVGKKLMFGARKGVTKTVAHWFFAHLEHHLGK
jgi:hypothetical protein